MDIKQFLNLGYTAYHSAANACRMLNEAGFERLSLGDAWSLKQGGKYYVTRNGSSVIAFKIGKNKTFNICACHTDSPALKVKGDCVVVGENVSRVNVEKYGGGLLHTFFDRPLKIAGRILVESASGVEQKLVVSDYNVVIPSLAIHHNPSANDGFAVNPQIELPLLGQNVNSVYSMLTNEKVLDADLYVVPSGEAFSAGVNGELLCSARLDNLTSVYACVNAIINCESNNIPVIACLDNEEVGSGTRQGNPSFVEQTLSAISEALKLSVAETRNAYENGMALSVDNGHAVHPAHPEKSDPKLRAHLNGGVTIKHHPNYATDGLTSAILKKLLLLAGVPCQDYYNNSSVRCGTTLGLSLSSKLGIKTCDIGIAQLAMHSACETCGASDVMYMQKCLTSFLSACISGQDDISIKL